MARGDTAVINTQDTATDSTATTPDSNGTVTTVELGADGQPAKRKRTRSANTISLTMPNDLQVLLKAKASEGLPEGSEPNVAALARKVLADYVGYTLPVTTARSSKVRYAKGERMDKMRALLAAFERGEIDPTILGKAEGGSEPAAEAVA